MCEGVWEEERKEASLVFWAREWSGRRGRKGKGRDMKGGRDNQQTQQERGVGVTRHNKNMQGGGWVCFIKPLGNMDWKQWG